MLIHMLKFLTLWFFGAAALGLLLGRMIRHPGETPALIRKAGNVAQDTVEEKAG